MRLPVILAALLAAASPALGQIVEPPPRPTRPVFGTGRAPDRTTQSLSVSVDLLGGYSRNQVSDETLTPGVEFRPSSGTVSGHVILN
jgi:hypothetical protein